MLILDELKKNDPQLRLVAGMLAAGLFILLAGLWWVQVVSARKYQGHLDTQSYRTVRLPAMRGKILDREGRVLAENRARYNLNLYLDDLRLPFYSAYTNLLKSAQTVQKQNIANAEKKLRRPLTKTELKQFQLKKEYLQQLRAEARVRVAGNILAQVSEKIGQPLALDAKNFNSHYARQLALPYPALKNLDAAQIARFEENFTNRLGADLELESVRSYPNGTMAGHLLGYVLRDDEAQSGENSYFNYFLPDYRGRVGVEAGFDAELRGRAGEESVLVNSLGYRQSENIWNQPEPGHNVVLTIDLDIQRAAEAALAAHQGADARAAVVVMDVRTGDVLAMVSSPAMDPNYFMGGLPADEFQEETTRLNDPKLRPQINRATQENYAPGSVFKPVVGLAALENGLDPNETYQVQPDPARPGKGCIYVGARKIEDTVSPGPFNFRRAIKESSNSYFIFNGLRTRIEKIVQLAAKFHFGEGAGLPTRQDTKGNFPTLERVRKSDWRDGDSANIFFGQGEMAVTPMQMAVAYSAIANGGTVLWPRLIERIEPQNPVSGETVTNFPSGLVRDEIGVQPRSLKILRDAMLSETEDPDGTGYPAFHQGNLNLKLRVCGKTGTAQVKNEHGQLTDWNYWFASFAPYDNPRYAVVVMVQSENKGSGGSVCAPIAHDIYEEILKKENTPAPGNLAGTN
jgi:penicillin-binding protein 2